MKFTDDFWYYWFKDRLGKYRLEKERYKEHLFTEEEWLAYCENELEIIMLRIKELRK